MPVSLPFLPWHNLKNSFEEVEVLASYGLPYNSEACAA